MAVMVLLDFDTTSDSYNDVMKYLELDETPPEGGIFHVVGMDERGHLRVTDVWESAEDFQAFGDQRLGEALQKAGVTSQPEVTIMPVHNLYSPNQARLAEMGKSSLPS